MEFYQNLQHADFTTAADLGHAAGTIFLTPVWIEHPISVREIWATLQVVVGAKSSVAIYQMSHPHLQTPVTAPDVNTLENRPIFTLVAKARNIKTGGGRARFSFNREANLDPSKQYAVAWVSSVDNIGWSRSHDLDIHYSFVSRTLSQLGLAMGQWPRTLMPTSGTMYAACLALLSDKGIRALAR